MEQEMDTIIGHKDLRFLAASIECRQGKEDAHHHLLST